MIELQTVKVSEATAVPGLRTLASIEKEVILNTLTALYNNKTHTARALGISIRTLRNKLAKYRREALPQDAT